MPGRARTLIVMAAAVLFAHAASAVSGGRVLPVEAIDASATMRAADFHEAFPGVKASPEVLGVPGYFVVYEHENLRYYFGPVNGFGEARVWEDRLLAIREEVVAQRPALATSRVYLYRFNYENSRAWSARHDEAPPSPQDDDGAEAPENTRAPSQPGPDGNEAGDEDAEPPATPRPGEENTADPGETAPPAPRDPPREDNALWRFIRRVFGFS